MDILRASAKIVELVAKASQGMESVLSNPLHEARMDRMHTNVGRYGVDAFGFDPRYLRRIIGLGSWIYEHYFRCQTYGIENIPDKRCLLIANHSGQIPFDAFMLCMAVFLEREPPRFVRSMVERFVPSTPFVSPFLTRWGQVLGTPENCRRLLAAEEIIQVFPEGVRGLNKTFTERYQLQYFGQGFMRLAIEMQAPIVPVVVIGAEEQAPSVYNFKRLGRLFGLPAFPIALSPLFGLLPLPTRYRIYFGEPMLFTGNANDEDDMIIEKVNTVQETMRNMIQRGLAQRQHIFW